MSENKNIIEYQVCSYGADTCFHRQLGVLGLTKRAGVAFGKSLRYKTYYNYRKILFGVLQGKSKVTGFTAFVKEKAYKRLSEQV